MSRAYRSVELLCGPHGSPYVWVLEEREIGLGGWVTCAISPSLERVQDRANLRGGRREPHMSEWKITAIDGTTEGAELARWWTVPTESSGPVPDHNSSDFVQVVKKTYLYLGE